MNYRCQNRGGSNKVKKTGLAVLSSLQRIISNSINILVLWPFQLDQNHKTNSGYKKKSFQSSQWDQSNFRDCRSHGKDWSQHKMGPFSSFSKW